MASALLMAMACGGNDTAKGSDNTDSGIGGTGATGGMPNSGGTSNGGTSNGGTSTNGGTSNGGDAADASLDASVNSDGGLDASTDGSVDAGDGAVGFEIDAGSGCNRIGTANQLSAAAAGLPTNGLVLWLRADRGVYATSQNRVCAWVDQSGNDHVLRSTPAGEPLWVEDGLGGQAAIHFDVLNTPLTIGGVLGIPATSARTLVAVTQLVNTTGRFQPLMQGASGTPGTYLNIDANTFDTAGSREGVYVMNNAYDSALATGTMPRIHLFTIDTMTVGTPILGAIDYRVNGVSQALTRTPGGLGNGNFEDFSAANFTLVGNGPEAILAEAILYDRVLTPTERTSVEAALTTRYGIQ